MKEKWYLNSAFLCILSALWFFLIPIPIVMILLFKKHKYSRGLDEKELKVKSKKELEILNSEKIVLKKELEILNSEKIVLEDEILMQSYGIYNPKYGFDSSEIYKQKLDDIRNRQKELIRNKVATNHSLDWCIDNNKKDGKAFILDTIKLSLKAFNMECDNIISNIKFNNIEMGEKRIEKAFNDINKLTDMQRVSIKEEYLNLKLKELYLKYEFERKKQKEKEEQQEIKARLKEEEIALKEIEKAREKVEKEEQHFKKAIQTLNVKLDKSIDFEKEKILKQLSMLKEQLHKIEKNKEDLINREQNTRAGYVYVISNIGSFGEDVYKIGMTRRLEPLDRVKELSDASVPFKFDVHAMIFSNDAPTLENELHKYFDDKKVNKMNNRKEFFKVKLSEIEDIVKKHHNETVEFTKLAEAMEYRESLAIEKQLKSQTA